MKKMAILVLFFALFSFIKISPVFSKNTLSSQIETVVLFTNQALITRTAAVKVKKGLNELLIQLNAFSLDKDSIQANVYGKGEVYSVQFNEIYLKEEPQTKIKDLMAKIETLCDKKRELINEKIVLNKKEKFLNSLIDFSGVQIPQDIKTTFPKAENLNSILAFLSDKYASINKKRESLGYKERELSENIQVLKAELASLKRPGRKTKKVIEILFNSKKEQKIEIEVDYLVPNAFWYPLYKVNIPSSLEAVNLTMFSKIRQKTGEDWQDIRLSLSNITPLKGVKLPSLNSWFLDIARDRKKEDKTRIFSLGKITKTITESRDSFGGELDEGASSLKADFIYAKKKELPFSFEYKMLQALTVESKDKETILPLFSKAIKGAFFHYTVPKTSPLAFFVCKASADKELLAGILNVHFSGRFVDKTYIEEKKAGEDFNLNLGVDREVKVKREKIKDKIEEMFFKRIQRQTIIRKLSYKITIENLKNKPIKIKVLDNIPVAQTDRIEIKDIELFPQPVKKNYQDKNGLNLWILDIEPKRKEEINISFTLTYPKNMPVFDL